MLSVHALGLLCLLLVSLTAGYPQSPSTTHSFNPTRPFWQFPSAQNTTRFAGVNICGFDFGCDFEGKCDLSGIAPPLNDIAPTYSTGMVHNGPAQMDRFVHADHLNMFRLPVSWQYLTNNSLGGRLNPTHFAHYDLLVRHCLRTGAHCLVDMHNYARWNGTVIGEPGGPTNEQFADIWGQIAEKYASDDRVFFGLMNEPHDMASVEGWAASVQAAVTAIRRANARTQFISLPGTGWQSAGALPHGGIGEALSRVTNPDNSTTGLVFDVHFYLNVNGTGQTAECVTDGISATWKPLAAWLRMKGRQAIVTETGGSSTSSCVKHVCQQLQYLRSSPDVFLGYLLWAAGSFRESYVLSLSPIPANDTWVDTKLVTECLAR